MNWERRESGDGTMVLAISRRLQEEANCVETSAVLAGPVAAEAAAVVMPQDYAHATYKPYPIDWRFLPERALLVKDSVRHLVVSAGMKVATTPATQGLWRTAFRKSMVPPVIQAGRLFIHIPKTGGTSICSHLYGRNLPHVTAAFWRELFAVEIQGVPSFAVLREPLERLGSAYRFLRNGGTDIMAASRYEMFKVHSNQSFEQFVDRLYDRPELLRSILTLKPQADFVCATSGDVIVDRLFRLSSGVEPASLIEWLGIKALPRINCSRAQPIGLSKRVVSRVEQLYESDFKLFHKA